ncbi:hypothetical protein [Ruegeria sp.]|uniref:hypothetical protein n=1 Tax=Ruegeria sp. TaxID=1879320 RepID=UPI003C7D2C81
MTDRRERQRQKPRIRGNLQQKAQSEQPDSNSETPPGGQGKTGGTGSGGRGGWLAAAAVAVAAVAIGAFTVFGGAGGGGDTITEAESQSRIESHQALLASPGLPVRLVGADEVDDAIASMPDNVSQEAREEIREQINQGGLQLAWVTLWDTHAEDGDILRFESTSSIPIEVMALNARTTFAIPYPADGQVLVTGVKDGGGGITIALESGAASIAWPTMAPGDQLLLPITPGF